MGRDEGMIEVEHCRQTWREKELKTGQEDRGSTSLKEGEGRDGDRNMGK